VEEGEPAPPGKAAEEPAPVAAEAAEKQAPVAGKPDAGVSEEAARALVPAAAEGERAAATRAGKPEPEVEAGAAAVEAAVEEEAAAVPEGAAAVGEQPAGARAPAAEPAAAEQPAAEPAAAEQPAAEVEERPSAAPDGKDAATAPTAAAEPAADDERRAVSEKPAAAAAPTKPAPAPTEKQQASSPAPTGTPAPPTPDIGADKAAPAATSPRDGTPVTAAEKPVAGDLASARPPVTPAKDLRPGPSGTPPAPAPEAEDKPDRTASAASSVTPAPDRVDRDAKSATKGEPAPVPGRPTFGETAGARPAGVPAAKSPPAKPDPAKTTEGDGAAASDWARAPVPPAWVPEEPPAPVVPAPADLTLAPPRQKKGRGLLQRLTAGLRPEPSPTGLGQPAEQVGDPAADFERLSSSIEQVSDVLGDQPLEFYERDLPQIAAAETARRVRADVVVLLLDNGEGLLEVSGGVGLTPAERRMNVDYNRDVMRELFRAGVGLVEDTDRVRGALAGIPGSRAETLVMVPLVHERLGFGVLIAGRRRSANGQHMAVFTDQEVEALMNFADDAAPSLRTAVLLRHLKRQLKPIE